jgi:Uma2 family endonuclease
MDMATRTLIPVEEYLANVYRPDCDYVDGEVLERNLGEKDHGRLQLKLGAYFLARQSQWNTYAIVEQRVQVRPGRFRIPDVCVLLGETDEQVLTAPPFLCVEILSPEDRMTRVLDRIDDYFKMGVPNVWVVDPVRREAFHATASGDLHRVSDVLRTSNPSLEVPLTEIFE